MDRWEAAKIIQGPLNDLVFTLCHTRGRRDDKPATKNIYWLVRIGAYLPPLATMSVPSVITSAGYHNERALAVPTLGISRHDIVMSIYV